MMRPVDPRALATATFRTLGTPGLAAVSACAIAMFMLIRQLPPLASAVLISTPPAAAGTESDGARIEAYRSAFAQHLRQSTGRSMFFIPPAPPPPTPEPEPDAPSQPDPPPSSYGGPAIIAMVGDIVWLADGSRYSLADESARDIDVVSLSPPWSARLRWKGVEFDVPLFDRTTARFLLNDQPPDDPDPIDQQQETPAPTDASSDPTPQE